MSEQCRTDIHYVLLLRVQDKISLQLILYAFFFSMHTEAHACAHIGAQIKIHVPLFKEKKQKTGNNIYLQGYIHVRARAHTHTHTHTERERERERDV
jgi:hypothetical protein